MFSGLSVTCLLRIFSLIAFLPGTSEIVQMDGDFFMFSGLSVYARFQLYLLCASARQYTPQALITIATGTFTLMADCLFSKGVEHKIL